jgi:hypothetical protein
MFQIELTIPVEGVEYLCDKVCRKMLVRASIDNGEYRLVYEHENGFTAMARCSNEYERMVIKPINWQPTRRGLCAVCYKNVTKNRESA